MQELPRGHAEPPLPAPFSQELRLWEGISTTKPYPPSSSSSPGPGFVISVLSQHHVRLWPRNQQGEGGDCPPVPRSRETPPSGTAFTVGPQHRDVELLESRGGHGDAQRLEQLCWEERPRGLGLLSLERRRPQGDLTAAFRGCRG